MIPKKEIERIRRECLEQGRETPEMDSLLNNLRLRFDNSETLSICEEQLICSALRGRPDLYKINFYTDLRSSTYWFNLKYLQYCTNLNGDGIIRNFQLPGNPIIPQSEVTKDIAYLDQEYNRIQNLLAQRATADEMLNNFKSESNHQLREQHKFSKRALHGYFKQQYEKKKVTLHAWFLFLKVKEYFQELGKNEIVIPYTSGEIVIDSYVYIHVLFRHFAQTVTYYQDEKSYHFDQINISHEWLLDQIANYVQEYLLLAPAGSFNERFISLKLNGQYYDIWLRKMSKSIKGGGVRKFLRVQSYYPVDKEKDLKRIKALNEIKVSENLSFFV